MHRFAVSILATAILAGGAIAEEMAGKEDSMPPALSFSMKSLDGQNVPLSTYQGKVLLLVNVASECGLTPQYEGLQALYATYADKGLAVLGFPCNQFGGQEPGTDAEIAQFCSTNYDVQFPMFSKIEVNGDGAAPLYKYLTALDLEPKGAGDVSWNFEKFVIDRKGNVVARFDPRTAPSDSTLVALLETELAK